MKQTVSIFMGIVFFTAVVTGLSLAEYSAELRNAYDWAFSNKITTQKTIEEARLDGEITRQSLAKMMVVYSKEMLYKKPDTSIKCKFNDMDEITEDLKGYAVEACQLGIMGQGDKNFNPMGKVTKAEFGTILSRSLWGNMYEGSDPYYLSHLKALEENNILDDISDPEEVNVSRGVVITALMRSINSLGHTPLLFSEDLENYYQTYDPEIEYLMNQNNLSENEKEVIRSRLAEINAEFYEKVENMFSVFLEDTAEGSGFIESVKITRKNINDTKTYFNELLSNYKKIYETLNVDLNNTVPFTPGENFSKMEGFSTTMFKVIDHTHKMLSFIIDICNDGKCENGKLSEELKNIYSGDLEKLENEFEVLKEEYDEAMKAYDQYLTEYKYRNTYWRAYQDSLIDPEDAQYSPKNAHSISGYLVWDDLTRYQGDVKNGRLEGNGILVSENTYYSGEFKNNTPHGYGELHGDGYIYTGNYRNGFADGYGIYTNIKNNNIYKGEWLNGVMHGKGEYIAENYTFSGDWKFNHISEGTIKYNNGVTYEGTFQDALFHGKGKLTLVSKDVYEGDFYEGYINGFGKLTLTNGEIYSGEWEDGHLSGQGIYIGDGKVIFSSKIDIIDNQWNDTIVISDGVDTITMMNKNLGADEVGTGESSYGSFFKWGNNTAFSSSSTGDSEEFYKANTGIWNEKDQGPCPAGYHIPTINEWKWVIDMRSLKNDKEDLDHFISTFKLPRTGLRTYLTKDDIDGMYSDMYYTGDLDMNPYMNINSLTSNGYYWASNKDGSAGLLYINHFEDKELKSYNLRTSRQNIKENEAYPIRCFKD